MPDGLIDPCERCGGTYVREYEGPERDEPGPGTEPSIRIRPVKYACVSCGTIKWVNEPVSQL